MSFWVRYPKDEVFVTLPEGESVTAVKGNLGYIDADGFVEECAANAANIDVIFAEDAHNDTTDGDSNIRVIKISPGMQLRARTHSTTATTQIGGLYALVVTSSVHYVDTSDTDNDAFKVIGLDPRDAVGTTNGRVFVEVLTSISDTEGA